MPCYHVSGSRTLIAFASVEEPDIQAAIRRFQKVHPNYMPTEIELRTDDGELIDTETFLSFCEGCKRAIFDGEEYATTEDGVNLCQPCVVNLSDEDHHL